MAKRRWDITDLVRIPPFVNHIFNVFINIYEYEIYLYIAYATKGY